MLGRQRPDPKRLEQLGRQSALIELAPALLLTADGDDAEYLGVLQVAVLGCVGVSQPDPTGESPVTTAKSPARYDAIWARAYGRLCSTELHHHWGHNRLGGWVPLTPLIDASNSDRETSAVSLHFRNLNNTRPSLNTEPKQ
jgi:hypothetical protein